MWGRKRREARRIANSNVEAAFGRLALITPDMAEETLEHGGRIYNVRRVSDYTFRVNNRIVQARWGVSGHGYASGEVLERAMRLAIAAHPQTMAAFDCGTRLEPGHP